MSMPFYLPKHAMANCVIYYLCIIASTDKSALDRTKLTKRAFVVGITPPLCTRTQRSWLSPGFYLTTGSLRDRDGHNQMRMRSKHTVLGLQIVISYRSSSDYACHEWIIHALTDDAR